VVVRLVTVSFLAGFGGLVGGVVGAKEGWGEGEGAVLGDADERVTLPVLFGDDAGEAGVVAVDKEFADRVAVTHGGFFEVGNGAREGGLPVEDSVVFDNVDDVAGPPCIRDRGSRVGNRVR
jgi:hypothetical protein